ncbi:MAG: exosortase/archaeosortase family protein [Pseudomonadales bacterium]|nr:exosortase/archaeosortase family protein [Pseudomonadales bacterium]
MQDSPSKINYQAALYGIALITLITTSALMASATADLVKDWMRLSEGYGHGVIIFGLFLTLFHNELKQVKCLEYIASPIAASLLIAVIMLAMLLNQTSITMLQQLLLPVVFTLMFITICGKKAIPLVLAPSAILYFAIPVLRTQQVKRIFTKVLLIRPFNR